MEVINIKGVNHSLRDFASRLIHEEDQRIEDDQWKQDRPLRNALRNYIDSDGKSNDEYTINW